MDENFNGNSKDIAINVQKRPFKAFKRKLNIVLISYHRKASIIQEND